jgi:cell division protein FtsN
MRNYYKRQHGGTIVGIIIGLVVGLAIALGVAVTINKTPMPFTNKMARPEKAEPTAGQIADPNKALYGNKAAAKEAAKAAAREKEPAPIDPQVAEQKSDVKSDGKPAVIDLSTIDKPKKAEAKPVEVKSTDAKADAKTDSAEDKWNYYLQAGAFREPTDAENTRAKLALLGVEARVTERQAENGTLYRVRIGPFPQMEAMNRVRGKLSDNGVDAAIVRIAK